MTWYALRTDRDSLVFNEHIRNAARVLDGSEFIDLHDHDDGTACVLLSGPFAEHLYDENGDGVTEATVGQLIEAGLRPEEDGRHV